jgi:hypothetical protein
MCDCGGKCHDCQASDRVMELRYKSDLEPWELCEMKFLTDILLGGW